MRKFENGSLVTVIITSYNSAKFIHGAINSVLGQKYQNWELLVIDDGSTDDTVSITKSLLNKNSRAKVIAQNHNSGLPSVVRNLGINEARGKYIAFLDADDAWRNRKLTRQLQIIESQGPAVGVHSQMLSVKESGTWMVRSLQPPNQKHTSYETLLTANMISLSSAMVCTEAIRHVGGFSELSGLRGFEDYELWLRLSQIGSIIYCPEIHGRYLVRQGSLSDGQSKQMVHKFLSEELNYPIEVPLDSLFRHSQIARVLSRVIRTAPPNFYDEICYQIGLPPRSIKL